MRISSVVVNNYRSLRQLTLDVDDYTALVGANGAGKSSLLYALQWFYQGGALEPEDIHDFVEPATPEADWTVDERASRTVSVTVTFEGLSSRDRAKLKEYGRGTSVTFRKTWTLGQQKPKVVGNALQGPGFAEVRAMRLVGEFRPGYKALRDAHSDLADLGSSPSKEAVSEELARWESLPANTRSLVELSDQDASHMFGIDGPNVITKCSRLILVPAAAEIANQVGNSGKGSTLGDLIGTVMANAGASARAMWLTKYAAEIEELNLTVKASVEASTVVQADRINSRLSDLIPNALVQFVPSVPEFAPKGEAAVSTNVTIDGVTNDVSKQGHGVQRAIMIAMLQSLVPDVALITSEHSTHDGESAEDAEARLADELADLPALIVCIEEPEIYQHPVRARAFARVLAALSEQAGVQVLLATHSPYFLRPAQFESLRRVCLVGGQSSVDRTSVADVAIAAGVGEGAVLKIIQKRLPTAFSEGFFSDVVVLVEGDTDQAVLEALGEKLGTPFDSEGISVLEVSSKESLSIPFALLRGLNIPTYVVFDSDWLGASRKNLNDAAKQAQSHASHKQSTERILGWLPPAAAIHGSLPFQFGDPTTIASHYCVWNDDIEEELGNWPSFIAALTSDGGALRQKDVLAYRSAVIDADLADLPPSLKAAVEAIIAFRSVS